MHPTHEVEISHDDLYLAAKRWTAFWGVRTPDAVYLSVYLGVYHSINKDKLVGSEEAAQKIRLLCSPHYETILRAHMASMRDTEK